MKKTVACILQHSPYGQSLGREGLEAALALAALEVPIKLCCLGQGLWQLVKHQDSNALSLKPYTKAFEALSLYDITTVYVSSTDLAQHNLKAQDFLTPVTILEPNQLARLIAECDFSWGL